MKNTISITDVVNLIIDKRVKEIEVIIAEKKKISHELENKMHIRRKENVNKLKEFFNEHFEEDGLKYFIETMFFSMEFNRRAINMKEEVLSTFIFKQLSISGLILKNSNTPLNELDTIEKEIEILNRKRYDILNSKDALIAEVTLQRLNSIDVDFEFKLDLLSEKIFNNKQLQ